MLHSANPLPLLALGVLLSSGLLRAQDEPAAKLPKTAIGERLPELTFREFLSGEDGRQKLSEFRGQPVLIVNWTDTDFGLGAATQAKKLAADLASEGLVTILMDSHNKKEEQIRASGMRLFPGSPSRLMQTQNLPIAYLDNGPPPDVALIGVDGTLLLAGSYTIDLSKAEKLVKAELKKLKSGWGEHEAARAARALAFGQQRLAAARAAIAEALAAESGAAELGEVRSEIEARFASWDGSVQQLMERGDFLLAQARARALAEAVSGDAEWAAQAAVRLAAFEQPEAVQELELDRKLTALLGPLEKRKPNEGDVAKLRKLAEGAGDSRVGARALRLAETAQLAAR
jgi:hypothetical protein